MDKRAHFLKTFVIGVVGTFAFWVIFLMIGHFVIPKGFAAEIIIRDTQFKDQGSLHLSTRDLQRIEYHLSPNRGEYRPPVEVTLRELDEAAKQAPPQVREGIQATRTSVQRIHEQLEKMRQDND